jgi:hypothetical protein
LIVAAYYKAVEIQFNLYFYGKDISRGHDRLSLHGTRTTWVGFVALRQTRRQAKRQATESFAKWKSATPQNDRCAVSAKSQRDLAHLESLQLNRQLEERF